jgi:hypothetical protein
MLRDRKFCNQNILFGSGSSGLGNIHRSVFIGTAACGEASNGEWFSIYARILLVGLAGAFKRKHTVWVKRKPYNKNQYVMFSGNNNIL